MSKAQDVSLRPKKNSICCFLPVERKSTRAAGVKKGGVFILTTAFAFPLALIPFKSQTKHADGMSAGGYRTEKRKMIRDVETLENSGDAYIRSIIKLGAKSKRKQRKR